MKFAWVFALLAALACESRQPLRSIARVQPLLTGPAAPSPNCLNDPANCKLTYWGGPVLPNVKVYQVNWTSSVSTTTNLPDFLQRITDSPYLDWMDEYSTNINDAAGQPGTQQMIGRGVFAGTRAITPAVNTGTAVDDADVVDELKRQIAAGALPRPDDNSLYMTFFPLGTTITNGSAKSCSAGGFCGYHGTFALDGRNVYYAVLPSHDAGSGCDLGCGPLTATASHELLESITDPAVGLANTTAAPLGWYAFAGASANYGEISDICDAATLDAALLAPYTVQKAFSNSIAATSLSGACVTSRAGASDFSVGFNAPGTAVSVVAGGRSVVVPVVTANTGSGVPQTLALSIGTPPKGVTATLDVASVTAGTGANLTLKAAASASNTADLVLALTGTDGVTTHTAGLLVQLTGGIAPDDFDVAVTPASQAVAAGASATYTVQTTASGTPDTVTLSAGTLPAGVTGNATFNPATLTAGNSSTLTLTTSAAAANALPASFEIIASGTVVTHSTVARIGLGIAANNDYALSIAPASGLVSPGGTKAFTVTAQAVSGKATGIGLSVSGLPSGVSGAFNPPTIDAGATSILTLTASAGAPLTGAAAFTVRGQDSLNTVRTTPAQVAVVAVNDFTLALTPAFLAVAPGQSRTVGVTATLINGGPETISLSVSGLPAGVTGSFNPATITPGQASVLTLSAGANAPLLTGASVTVSATAPSVTHNATIPLSVTGPPTVSIARPADGSNVGGPVEIDVQAAAAPGATLVLVEILLDGAVIATQASAPLQTVWQSTGVPDGQHTIAARVTDDAGSSASSTITVASRNTPVPLPKGGGCASSGSGVGTLLGVLVLLRRRRVT